MQVTKSSSAHSSSASCNATSTSDWPVPSLLLYHPPLPLTYCHDYITERWWHHTVYDFFSVTGILTDARSVLCTRRSLLLLCVPLLFRCEVKEMGGVCDFHTGMVLSHFWFLDPNLNLLLPEKSWFATQKVSSRLESKLLVTAWQPWCIWCCYNELEVKKNVEEWGKLVQRILLTVIFDLLMFLFIFYTKKDMIVLSSKADFCGMFLFLIILKTGIKKSCLYNTSLSAIFYILKMGHTYWKSWRHIEWKSNIWI